MKKIIFLSFLVTLVGCGINTNARITTTQNNSLVTTGPILHNNCDTDFFGNTAVCAKQTCDAFFSDTCGEDGQVNVKLFQNECSMQEYGFAQISMDYCKVDTNTITTL